MSLLSLSGCLKIHESLSDIISDQDTSRFTRLTELDRRDPPSLPASRNLVREMSRQTRTCKKPPRASRDKKNVAVLGMSTQCLFQSQLTFVLWQGQQRRRRSQQILQKRGGAAVLRQLARFHEKEEVCSGSQMQNLQSTLSLRKKRAAWKPWALKPVSPT